MSLLGDREREDIASWASRVQRVAGVLEFVVLVGWAVAGLVAAGVWVWVRRSSRGLSGAGVDIVADAVVPVIFVGLGLAVGLVVSFLTTLVLRYMEQSTRLLASIDDRLENL